MNKINTMAKTNKNDKKNKMKQTKMMNRLHPMVFFINFQWATHVTMVCRKRSTKAIQMCVVKMSTMVGMQKCVRLGSREEMKCYELVATTKLCRNMVMAYSKCNKSKAEKFKRTLGVDVTYANNLCTWTRHIDWAPRLNTQSTLPTYRVLHPP